MFQLDASENPSIANSIELLKKWNREADVESEAAALFVLTIKYLRRELKENNKWRTGDYINEKIIIEAISYSQNYMKKHFDRSPVKLGELQRHSRGKVDLPVSGGPDVLAAMKAIERKDGRLRADSGDSYIELVRYSAVGVEIESINAFGASAKPDSPHYTDQMEMYVNRQLKKMTLDKEMVYKNAESIYHPK
jgi:acyl-homoserine-lactone acylase